MSNRVVPAILIALLVILHAQLWFGRGSLTSVSQMRHKLDVQNQHNMDAQLAVDRLASEVRDLREGLEMVEEKARLELGMVKPDEIYVQISK